MAETPNHRTMATLIEDDKGRCYGKCLLGLILSGGGEGLAFLFISRVCVSVCLCVCVSVCGGGSVASLSVLQGCSCTAAAWRCVGVH